jgi:hypothetical protein
MESETSALINVVAIVLGLALDGGTRCGRAARRDVRDSRAFRRDCGVIGCRSWDRLVLGTGLAGWSPRGGGAAGHAVAADSCAAIGLKAWALEFGP